MGGDRGVEDFVVGGDRRVEDFVVGGDRRVEDLVVKLMMCPFCIIKT